MTGLLLLALLAGPAQDSFNRFSYCHDYSRGPHEMQCVELDSKGAGEFHTKRREGNDLRVPVSLSPKTRDRFVALLSRTEFLKRGAQYESGRNVADLGTKRLAVELSSGRREAIFNYSALKEVQELSTFMEGVISQQALIMEVELALEHDRLRIPELLTRMQSELKVNALADPAGLSPILEKVENDRRVLDYARNDAARIRRALK